MKILILRHGQTESSMLGHFTGRADVSLTPEGEKQAGQWREVLAEFGRPGAASVAVSPLRRCAQTADAAGVRGETWAELAEWDLGSLDGMIADDYRRAHPDWNLFVDGPPAGTGETPDAVRARAALVLERVRSQEGDAILVTHGQFAKMLAVTALGMPTHSATRLALGPAKAGLLLERTQGMSLAGWNLPPAPGRLWSELT